MLDSNLKEQLTELFSSLSNKVEFSFSRSTHQDQAQLLEMLNSVAETSAQIAVVESPVNLDGVEGLAAFPEFKIVKNGVPTGIEFKGIPNGHEFSSLILAVLHSDGKGRQFDEFLAKRVRNLKGPIHIKTYVSLTCENCPDVVQALNQMAVLHGNFRHTMIDGAYVQSEIEALNIQGVPSVVVMDVLGKPKLIHSGRISVTELLAKLEESLGSEKVETQEINLGEFDVAVIGGGPAGASAAIYSARKGLKTIVIADRMGGQVQETKGIENLISVLYTEGPQLAGQIQNHILNYPVKLLEHRRVKKIETARESHQKPNKILLESGEFLIAKATIVATGAKWRELGIPGEKEYLGKGVAFCPHCDGPFYKGKKVAVIGGGNSGVEAAIDLSGIVKEVVVFEFNESLKADQVLVDKLNSLPNASIVTSARTKEVLGDGKKVTRLVYEDRKSGQDVSIDLDGVFVQIGLLPNSQFLKGTVELSHTGEIMVDAKGRTNVPGIYAAGDVTNTPYKQIIIAMGEGAKVALAAFEDEMLAG